MFRNSKSAILLCLCYLLATGCTSLLPNPHRIDVQQGNIIKEEDLQKIEPGMNRKQVRFVLGTPILRNTFHRDRWDYLYYLRSEEKEHQAQRVTLFFEDDTLLRIEKSTRDIP